jgi:hypothetical protein
MHSCNLWGLVGYKNEAKVRKCTLVIYGAFVGYKNEAKVRKCTLVTYGALWDTEMRPRCVNALL